MIHASRWFASGGSGSLKMRLYSLQLPIMAIAIAVIAGCDGDARRQESARLDPAADVCQRYIHVNWLSVDRSIGAASYDLIDQEGKRRHVQALVFLGGHAPSLQHQQMLVPSPKTAGISETRAQSLSGESIIRDWNIEYGLRGGAVGFSDGKGHAYRVEADAGGFKESVGQRESGVCIRFPDGHRTWIVEMPSARARYGDQLSRHFEEAVLSMPASDPMRPSLRKFAEAEVIDVNNDGLYDYPSLGILSYRGKYFALRRQSGSEQDLDRFGKVVFEGNGMTCELDPPDAIFIVADRGAFYINRKCNLTELSK